jgi:fatty-acyl-CoA synthase
VQKVLFCLGELGLPFERLDADMQFGVVNEPAYRTMNPNGRVPTIDDEGFITVVDRKKDMIKTGGENVASREVEEMVYRLAAVSEVAVIGLPDPKWVEAVTAVIVVKAGQALSEAEVLAHCQSHMAGFKCPKRVIFTNTLPKNPSGKLLKRELRKTYG